MSDSEETGISRRQAISAGSLVGVAAVAGCLGEMEEEGNGNGNVSPSEDTSPDLQPPTPPSADPDNEYWKFVIRSLEYQNRMMARQQEED